jgi:small basic protein
MRILVVEYRSLLSTLLVLVNALIAIGILRANRLSASRHASVRAWPLLGLIAANGVLFGIYYYPLPEDALISFRYARNLATGHGLVWNVGERVEGYSNFLWVVLLAGIWRVVRVFDLPVLARVVSFFLYVLLIARVFQTARKAGIDRSLALVVTWAVTVFPGFAVYGLSGLETTIFALLILASVEQHLDGRWAGVALCSGLAALCRLDGGLLPVFWLGVYLEGWLGRRQVDSPRGTRGLGDLLPLLGSNAATLAYHAWRVSYYGSLMPNAAKAKYNPFAANRLSIGAIQLEDFAVFSGLLLLFAAALYYLVVRPRLSKQPVMAAAGAVLVAGLAGLQALAIASPRYRPVVLSVLFHPAPGRHGFWSATAVYAARVLVLACVVEALWLLARHRRARLFPLGGVLLLISLFYVNAGGDWMVAWRYLTPLFPVGLVFLVAVLSRLAAPRAATWGLMLGVVGLNIGFALPLVPTSYSFLLDTWPSHLARNDKSSNDTRAYLDLQYRLIRIFGRDSPLVFAFEGAGAVPYYTNYRFIDTYGLTNRGVADHCRKKAAIGVVGQAHSCMDWDSVQQQNPDVVLQPTDPHAIDEMNALRGPGTRYIAMSRDHITMYVHEARVGLIPAGE